MLCSPTSSKSGCPVVRLRRAVSLVSHSSCTLDKSLLSKVKLNASSSRSLAVITYSHVSLVLVV